jgi:hypothetical protein
VINNSIALINTACENINLPWIIDLNTKIDHLACEFVKHHMWATSLNQIGVSIFVMKEIYRYIAYVKYLFQEATI